MSDMFPDKPGLSSVEVVERQQKFGKNVLPEKPPPSNLQLIFQQLKSPMIYVLVLAGSVTLLIGHLPDTLIIFLAVILNTVLGFIQERKASDALVALKKYVISQIVVVRDGQRKTIEATEAVPGDLVILSQGDKVPADGKIIFSNRLYIDEAVLTGESLPIQKKTDDLIFMGTTISAGQAMMLVEEIASETKIGKIALQIQEAETPTPLQNQLKKFSQQLLVVITCLITLVFVIGLLYSFSLMEMFTTSVALAVSSIPEGLIVSLTVVLAIGMQKILKRNGLVKKLSAAETLGGVTVICVDKTGTLTQGRMEVADAIGDKKALAEQVLLANDLDDPIVISAFEWGKTVISGQKPDHQRLDSIPFSSKERFFLSLHQWSETKNRIFVNGAPEHLLQWTTLSDDDRRETLAVIENLTKQGKRLIGLASKDVPLSKRSLETSDAKSQLTWVGILAFSDPVRTGVKAALAAANEAGIRSVVVTGDYAKTSEFVMSELGISLDPDEIMTGDQLALLSPTALAQKIHAIKLFARTTPDQKLTIVQAFKQKSEVVAMMGDGVNDAPALHAADIGIAVGEASDVAKESADLIILDSNFSTIIWAIEEGRVMFDNIRKVILYLMCDAFVEIIVIIGSILLNLPLPLTAIQILWINLVSDGFPNLALTVDPKRADIMKEKPRLMSEKLVNKWMVALIGFVSLVSGAITLSSFIYIYQTSQNIELARSAAFVMLGLNSLMYVFSVRTLMSPFWKNRVFENKWLVVGVLAGLCLQILPFTTSGLRQAFGVVQLDTSYWLVALGMSGIMFLTVEVFKYLYHLRQNKSKS